MSANEEGLGFQITTSESLSLGFRDSKGFSSPVPCVNTGAPFGVLCKICTILPPALRYFPSKEAMTAPEASALVTFSLPSAYSFCASMMTKAESEVDAVLGVTPKSSRKDFAFEFLSEDISGSRRRNSLLSPGSARGLGSDMFGFCQKITKVDLGLVLNAIS